MSKITNEFELNSYIVELQIKKQSEWILLKQEFYKTYESTKPAHIINSAFTELISTNTAKLNILNTLIGYISGVIAKKILVGDTHNPIKQIAGFILEMIVANKMSKNTFSVKLIGETILHKILKLFTNDEKIN